MSYIYFNVKTHAPYKQSLLLNFFFREDYVIELKRKSFVQINFCLRKIYDNDKLPITLRHSFISNTKYFKHKLRNKIYLSYTSIPNWLISHTIKIQTVYKKN